MRSVTSLREGMRRRGELRDERGVTSVPLDIPYQGSQFSSYHRCKSVRGRNAFISLCTACTLAHILFDPTSLYAPSVRPPSHQCDIPDYKQPASQPYLLRLLALALTPLPLHTRTRISSRLRLLLRRLLLRKPLFLLLVGALRIPLARLQHQHAHQHQRQDRITRAQHLQIILSPQHILARLPVIRAHGHVIVPIWVQDDVFQSFPIGPDAHDPQALDDVGDVDDDAGHVEDEATAVEEHVGLGGLVEFEDEAEEAEEDHDV